MRVADFLQPVDVLAASGFLYGDVGHGIRRRSAVPMLQPWRKPDDVTWPNLLDRASLALHPPKTGCDDQRLPKRMCVPGGAGARLERHLGGADTSRIGRLAKGIDADGAGEPGGTAL